MIGKSAASVLVYRRFSVWANATHSAPCCLHKARLSRWRSDHEKKLAILGIIGWAAILTAAPLSLQWSQKNVVLSLDSAKAGTATSAAGVNRRAYRRAAYGTAVAGSGGYGYSSPAYSSYWIPYGTSYAAPYGIYSSSYAIAHERLKSGYAAPYGPIFY
jgi:hypothetical protein